jgi:hypothetical protein
MTVAEASELRTALEAALREHGGAPVSVTHLERRPCEYRTSFALEELKVTLGDGAVLDVMFKDLSRACLSEDAQRAKPEFLHDPLREIEVYRDLLDGAGLGTPAYHGSSVDPPSDRYWLFIENVTGPVLWQVGDFAVYEEAARWLARMHAKLAAATPPASLLRYDQALLGAWIGRARGFAERPSTPWDDATRSAVIDLAGRYGPAVERLSALPATIIHGEFYPSNVIVQQRSGRVRIAPIDWEIAAVGPGLLDLAALTIGKWTPDQREALARAYREAAEATPGGETLPSDFDAALEFCRLHLAVQWLGWDPEWQPPADHRHDWLTEAVASVERLGL